MKKILALLVVCAMLLGMMSFTTFAASRNRNLTLNLVDENSDVVTTVEAGDKVTLTATIDSTALLSGISFYVAVPNIFEYDTTPFSTSKGGYNEDVYDETDLKVPFFVNEAWAMEYFGQKARYLLDNDQYGTDTDGNNNIFIYQAAKLDGIEEGNGTDNAIIFAVDLTVASNATAGEYDIYVYNNTDKLYASGTTDIGGSDTAAFVCEPMTITVKGGEPEVVVETAEGVAVYGPIDVTNNDGSEYTIDSALAFVSWVDNTKATPVKTVITRADAEGKELVIDAKHSADLGDKTYFVAAVSSIKETSIGKTFTATAYAKLLADGSEVPGVPATGVYTAPVAAE